MEETEPGQPEHTCDARCRHASFPRMHVATSNLLSAKLVEVGLMGMPHTVQVKTPNYGILAKKIQKANEQATVEHF